ncbi:MAG: sensor histidine kinase, partial [Candidatus Thorarchaeota archaeon]
ESEMPLQPIDLFNTLDNAVRYIRTNFSKRTINIEINSPNEGIYVLANELLLDVFENIMMNSIIYNRNEKIQIEILITEIMELGRKYIQLEFKDNGIGIDDARKIEILQENPRKSKNSRGMGLGLSLAAKLIDLYEGRMYIEDRIKGNSALGSNFVILIPKKTQPELTFYAFQKHVKID